MDPAGAPAAEPERPPVLAEVIVSDDADRVMVTPVWAWAVVGTSSTTVTTIRRPATPSTSPTLSPSTNVRTTGLWPGRYGTSPEGVAVEDHEVGGPAG